MTYAPIGMPDEVAYRLKALDKRRYRWPAIHLWTALGIAVITYFAVTRATDK